MRMSVRRPTDQVPRPSCCWAREKPVSCKICGDLGHVALRCAQACQEHGVGFLDAPISGGPQKARDGSLTIMCGGTQQAYDMVEPIMKVMGSHVRLMGGHGAGTAAKLVSKT